MKPTLATLRTPLIRFLGKRTFPTSIDHTPRPHPQSPTQKLPASFLQASAAAPSFASNFSTGKMPASPVAAKEGEFFSVTELPSRFRPRQLSEQEIETVNLGSADYVF
ncbi:hypothetical protein D0Z00_001580 [Geotrichum galactomycetum]|uniref:Uncharacterized protein n=1 Tax=Geotrichum galactomycetum TaxID=27317 RepID=A0ACB6V6I6_9ASCO|nr:hypothetical protein D0Z00_001580 [Geotrichum candidum]